nr:TPA_asm: hypothetical protein [Strongylocentrotus sea urchin adintovirus]
MFPSRKRRYITLSLSLSLFLSNIYTQAPAHLNTAIYVETTHKYNNETSYYDSNFYYIHFIFRMLKKKKQQQQQHTFNEKFYLHPCYTRIQAGSTPWVKTAMEEVQSTILVLQLAREYCIPPSPLQSMRKVLLSSPSKRPPFCRRCQSNTIIPQLGSIDEDDLFLPSLLKVACL